MAGIFLLMALPLVLRLAYLATSTLSGSQLVVQCSFIAVALGFWTMMGRESLWNLTGRETFAIEPRDLHWTVGIPFRRVTRVIPVAQIAEIRAHERRYGKLNRLMMRTLAIELRDGDVLLGRSSLSRDEANSVVGILRTRLREVGGAVQ